MAAAAATEADKAEALAKNAAAKEAADTVKLLFFLPIAFGGVASQYPEVAAVIAVVIVGCCCCIIAGSGGDTEQAKVIVKNSIRRVSFQTTKVQVAQEPDSPAVNAVAVA